MGAAAIAGNLVPARSILFRWRSAASSVAFLSPRNDEDDPAGAMRRACPPVTSGSAALLWVGSAARHHPQDADVRGAPPGVRAAGRGGLSDRLAGGGAADRHCAG